MAFRTRVYYAEQVLNQLKLPLRNRDDKIDIREVYVQLDNWLNERAKMGWIENMKNGFGSQLDDQFTTTFENLVITDPPAKKDSYFSIPANYAAFPDNQGIQEVFMMNNTSKKKYFDPIYILRSTMRSEDRNNMVSGYQGRLAVTIRNGIATFNAPNVGATYGAAGCRLVIKSAFDITDDAPYPVPSDVAMQMIQDVVEYFLNRSPSPETNIRDNNDKSA